MWIIAGVGFLAVAFAFVLAFVPPAQLPIGNPGAYIALVAGGAIFFSQRRVAWKDLPGLMAAAGRQRDPDSSRSRAAC